MKTKSQLLWLYNLLNFAKRNISKSEYDIITFKI